MGKNASGIAFQRRDHQVIDFTGTVFSVGFYLLSFDIGRPNTPRDTRGLPVIGVDVGINSLATLDDW